jgi:hypothetical protein
MHVLCTSSVFSFAVHMVAAKQKSISTISLIVKLSQKKKTTRKSKTLYYLLFSFYYSTPPTSTTGNTKIKMYLPTAPIQNNHLLQTATTKKKSISFNEVVYVKPYEKTSSQ